MAEMVGSALVQESVSRGISYVLGKREEKASQGHLMERLEMAASELEFALERAMELPIRHLSLLWHRKIIKSAYVEAMQMLDRQKQQEEIPPQGVKKRKLWAICANKNKSIAPFAGLSIDDVRRFERCADFAGRFVRDVESGCSPHHYTFCNPIVRHLLEGKTLKYSHLEQGNLRRDLYIWPTYSDERGVEAGLGYLYVDSTIPEKSFWLGLLLRLSESTDIVGVAIKCLQLLVSGFILAAECAMGELTSLYNLKDIAHLNGPPSVGIQEHTQKVRPDPACCQGSRHGLCSNNSNVSSGLTDIFPEQVIYLYFQCYISALESSTRRSSDNERGRSKSRGWKPPLTASFLPHLAIDGVQDSFAIEKIGFAVEKRDASIQQVVATLKSDVTNCFSRQPQLMKYEIVWIWKHGATGFIVEKPPSTESTGSAPKTKRRYNTRGSTRRSSGKAILCGV